MGKLKIDFHDTQRRWKLNLPKEMQTRRIKVLKFSRNENIEFGNGCPTRERKRRGRMVIQFPFSDRYLFSICW